MFFKVADRTLAEQCPRMSASDLLQTQKCNQHSCDVIEWDVRNWKDCIADTPTGIHRVYNIEYTLHDVSFLRLYAGCTQAVAEVCNDVTCFVVMYTATTHRRSSAGKPKTNRKRNRHVTSRARSTAQWICGVRGAGVLLNVAQVCRFSCV